MKAKELIEILASMPEDSKIEMIWYGGNSSIDKVELEGKTICIHSHYSNGLPSYLKAYDTRK